MVLSDCGAMGLAMARGVIQLGGGPLCFGARWLLLVGGVIVAVVVVVVVVPTACSCLICVVAGGWKGGHG